MCQVRRRWRLGINRPPASNAVALGTCEPVWPAQPLQVVQAVGISAEPGLELACRARVVQAATDLSHGLSLLRLNGEPELSLCRVPDKDNYPDVAVMPMLLVPGGSVAGQGGARAA